MNGKQTVPIFATLAPAIAAAAPPLIIGGIIVGAIYLVLENLFPDEKKKPEAAPANAGKESSRNETKTTRENPEFRNISAEISTKPVAAPVQIAPHEVIPQSAVPTAPKIPAASFSSVVAPKVQTAPPPPIKKPGIARADMVKIFQTEALTRQAAVAALKKLGFGQTAAYAAVLPDGRFSAWLHFAPDGVITWRD